MAAWVLVADEARARLFELDSAGGEWREIYDFVHGEGRGGASEPGSVTSGPPGHAFEPRRDAEAVEARRFARALVDFLEGGRAARRFEHLSLIAPPRFLGVLRGCLGSDLVRLVQCEIATEATREPVERIRARLAAGN